MSGGHTLSTCEAHAAGYRSLRCLAVTSATPASDGTNLASVLGLWPISRATPLISTARSRTHSPAPASRSRFRTARRRSVSPSPITRTGFRGIGLSDGTLRCLALATALQGHGRVQPKTIIRRNGEIWIEGLKLTRSFASDEPG